MNGDEVKAKAIIMVIWCVVILGISVTTISGLAIHVDALRVEAMTECIKVHSAQECKEFKP